MYKRRRPPHAAMNSTKGYLRLAIWGLVGIILILALALYEMNANPIAFCLITLAVLGGAVGLLVIWLRRNAARGRQEAIDARQRQEAIDAQRQYQASMARQQAEAAQRAWEARLAHINSLQALLDLTPTDFELAICKLFEFWGYSKVQHTGGAGDLAADITCRDTAGQLTVVQCKRYATGNLVGSPDIQKFIGMKDVHHHAQHGTFVTTSGYTEPALALGRQHGIRMIDGTKLVASMQQFRAAVEQRPAG